MDCVQFDRLPLFYTRKLLLLFSEKFTFSGTKNRIVFFFCFAYSLYRSGSFLCTVDLKNVSIVLIVIYTGYRCVHTSHVLKLNVEFWKFYTHMWERHIQLCVIPSVWNALAQKFALTVTSCGLVYMIIWQSANAKFQPKWSLCEIRNCDVKIIERNGIHTSTHPGERL